MDRFQASPGNFTHFREILHFCDIVTCHRCDICNSDLKPRIQLILNFHTDHLWPFFASEASVYLGSSVGERSEPSTQGPGAQPPAGSRGSAPGRGLGGAAPGFFFEKSKLFRPPESNSSTKIHPDVLNN